ncbi:MAG: hypothetical protein NC225_02725 [Clostridium sp.]|nr:hypothetical protein [Clostridium sp.]MCM1458957.1 hypothetical protein [Bacteroides sp.]
MRKQYIKKSLVLLCLATAIVTGGCGKEKERETTEKQTTESQRETTEAKKTEETTEREEETTTEETVHRKSLDVIELKAYSENRDGEDTISSHIKDITYAEGLLIVLSDDGHLYSYFTDSGFGYKIHDWGKPGWDMKNIERVNVTTSDYDGENGQFIVIEGNQYYYVELEHGEIVYNIEGVLLEGQEIADIRFSGIGFEVYCADGSWYDVLPDKEHDTAEPPYSDYIDSASFWYYSTAEEPDITFPEGLNLLDSAGSYYLLSDGKLYWESFMDAPIQDIADYTFTKLYTVGDDCGCMGLTDTNELLFMYRRNNTKDNTLETLYTIALPESEIFDVRYNNGLREILIIKTADGYYRCTPDLYSHVKDSLALEPDEDLNALTEDVIAIRHGYVLLDDGYVYELPGWVF